MLFDRGVVDAEEGLMGEAEHLTSGFLRSPRRHSFAQAGA
jgi:hypothetical protein